MTRPSWDSYFLRMADVVSERSTCLRRHVGAVLVRDKQIIATGYNGAPRGLPHCAEVGCIRDKNGIPSGTDVATCRANHAELNAIIQCAWNGVSTKSATLYCTLAPCTSCAKALINAGIVRVVYRKGYPDKMGLDMLKEANIEIGHYGF